MENMKFMTLSQRKRDDVIVLLRQGLSPRQIFDEMRTGIDFDAPAVSGQVPFTRDDLITLTDVCNIRAALVRRGILEPPPRTQRCTRESRLPVESDAAQEQDDDEEAAEAGTGWRDAGATGEEADPAAMTYPCLTPGLPPTAAAAAAATAAAVVYAQCTSSDGLTPDSLVGSTPLFPQASPALVGSRTCSCTPAETASDRNAPPAALPTPGDEGLSPFDVLEGVLRDPMTPPSALRAAALTLLSAMFALAWVQMGGGGDGTHSGSEGLGLFCVGCVASLTCYGLTVSFGSSSLTYLTCSTGPRSSAVRAAAQRQDRRKRLPEADASEGPTPKRVAAMGDAVIVSPAGRANGDATRAGAHSPRGHGRHAKRKEPDAEGDLAADAAHASLQPQCPSPLS